MTAVGTTAVDLGGGPHLIQNLGPDDIYVGEMDVSEETGFKLSSGQSVSQLYTPSTYVFSVGTSEVRRLVDGSGVFTVSTV